MKIRLAQIAGRGGDTVHSLERALAAIAGYAADTELVVLPETHPTGLPSENGIAVLVESLDDPTVSAVQRVARERNVSVAIGIAEVNADRYYNTTLLIASDGVTLKYCKTRLRASDRGIFTPGDRYATVLWNGIWVDLLVCLGTELLESMRVLGQLGAELIIVTNGNMDPYDPTHRTATMARVMENQAYVMMANRVGYGDGGLVFVGGSMVVDPYGQLLCEAGREECRQIIELDLGRLQNTRRDYRYLEERRLVLPGERRGYPDGLCEPLIP